MEINRNNSVTISAIHIQGCAGLGISDFTLKVSLTPGLGAHKEMTHVGPAGPNSGHPHLWLPPFLQLNSALCWSFYCEAVALLNRYTGGWNPGGIRRAGALPLVSSGDFTQAEGLRASPRLTCFGIFRGRWEMRALYCVSSRKRF